MRAALFATLLLTACGGALEELPPPPLPERTGAALRTPAQEPIASMSDIEGQWDIVSFDGYRPRRLDSDGGRHAYVDISGHRVAFAIECNYSGIETARIDNSRLVRVAGDDMQTEMGCGPEREQRDSTFFNFMRSRPTIARRGADGLVLVQDGVVLELQRASARQDGNAVTTLAELDGAWSTAIIYQQVAPGNTRNVLAFGNPGTAFFTFSNGAVSMTFDCETAEVQLHMNAPGALTAATPRRTTSGRCTLPQEDRDIAASLIAGDITAERIELNMLHLVAGDVRAVLTRR